MTVKEWYKQFKAENISKRCGDCCIYAEISGGPGFWGFTGCEHENHSNVSYGYDYCPKPCKDFKLLNDDDLLRRFFNKYLHHYDFYNQHYNISIDDPYYVNNHYDTFFDVVYRAQNDEEFTRGI